MSGASASESRLKLKDSQQKKYVIDIRDLSKEFTRKTAKSGDYTTLKSALLGGLLKSFFQRSSRSSQRSVVLDGITLRIPRGASVGIIGRNGSGKSTLLKLITGIYRPTSGTVSLSGRVAALIELGAGFHPDFSGRENLYLGGVMHGLKRSEIDDLFNDIVQFAELEHVIDDPVRTYSSGMFMRLGFSLAVHTDPDVLIVDEVLAVGDAAFVAKCKDKISELRKRGKTLLFVSHDLDAVERWCDEALWLQGGKVRDRGHPRRVIDHYREFLEKGEESEIERLNQKHQTEHWTDSEEGSAEEEDQPQERWGSREVEIVDVRMLDTFGKPKGVFHPDDSCVIEFSYVVHDELQDVVFGIGIQRGDGVLIHGTNTALEREELLKKAAPGERGTIRYRIERLGVLDGTYYLDVAAHREDGYPYDYHTNVLRFAVRTDGNRVGVVAFPHRWEIERTDSRQRMVGGV